MPRTSPRSLRLMPLIALLTAAPAPAQNAAPAHPPIAVPFTLKEPGCVTLVIEDASGRRVRNLVSETPFPAGANTAYWDGLDDLGRDPDAAAHSVFHIPGKLVPAGTYTARGLTRGAIGLRYQSAPYSPGSPPWETKDKSSWWLANHTPPQAALWVPEADSALSPAGRMAGGQMLIGSFVTEGGSGLAALDLDGRKHWGTGWIGGNWTAAPFLARDGGAGRVADTYAYVGAGWGDDAHPGRAEIRLTAMTQGGDRALPRYTFMPRKVEGRNDDYGAQLGGIAARNGLVVAALPRRDQLLFVDAQLHAIRGAVSAPDVRGIVFDGRGRLLALSGKTLVRYALPPALGPSVRLPAAGWTATASVRPEAAGGALDADAGSRWSTNGPQAPGQWFQVDMGKSQPVSTLVLRSEAGQDSPVGLEVAASEDGRNFKTVARGRGTPTTTTVSFPRTKARFFRLTQTGSRADVYWSINGLSAFDAPPALGAHAGLPAPQALVTSGLQDPQGLTVDGAGDIYVSDRGSAHQVKVFSPEGKFLHVIGRAGRPGMGPYDPNHMTNPHGLAVDGRGRLWVTENDSQPKRVSVWNARTGALITAFYGPPQYGGGGEMDPQNPRLFYYGGMTLALDPKKGRGVPLNVLWRPDSATQPMPGGLPQTPFYINGRKYLTNCHDTNPTGGASIAALWEERGGRAIPVAAMGQAGDWNVFDGLAPQTQNFSVRWSGVVTPTRSGDYTFSTLSDDGVRLTLNGRKLINNWAGHGATEDKGAPVHLDAGRAYPLVLEYFQAGGGGTIHLRWQNGTGAPVTVPSGALRPSAASKEHGLKGEYFSGVNFDTLKLTRVDASVDSDNPSLPVDSKKAVFAARLPQGAEPGHPLAFWWSDANGDGKMEAPEVTFRKLDGAIYGVTVTPDLSLTAFSLSGRTVRFAPKFNAAGVPLYDADGGEILAQGVQGPVSSGGGQALPASDGWTILTNAPKPFSPYGLGGVKNGVPMWSYPSPWPGLHASHIAPLPESPGEVIGTTRLIGGTITPGGGSDAGELWAINGNKGNIYVFTTDGLFVATLFKDSRAAQPLPDRAVPDTPIEKTSNAEEDFWPQWTQGKDGQVWLQTNWNGLLVRSDGWDTIRRLPAQTLNVTAPMLQEAQAYFVQSEAARQAQAGDSGVLSVPLRPQAPAVDGKLDEWPDTNFVTIDARQQQQGDWGRAEVKTRAALAVGGDRLFAAFKTGDAGLLNNAGDSLPLLFKSGGALDIQLSAIDGGERLLVTQVRGKTTAMLYRPKVAGTPATARVPFTSPLRTVLFDRVDDIGSQVQLAGDGKGNYELSVPLAPLSLHPNAGNIKGDIGILRGNGFQTVQRVYWHNKATGLVSDVPSEAELTPQLWGTMRFTPGSVTQP